jgi:hypothetical protein
VSEADKGDINLNVLAKLNQQAIKLEIVSPVCEQQTISNDHVPSVELPQVNTQAKGMSWTNEFIADWLRN